MLNVPERVRRSLARRIAKALPPSLPVEFTEHDKAVFDYVMTNRLTMVSPERMIATISACKYAVSLDGDFVECGVWRGGNAIAAKMIFDQAKADKTVWLFDTFEGMTKPGEKEDQSVCDRFHPQWCYASLEDVKSNFPDLDRTRFVKGDVLETLKGELPEKISVLRLDTDWYESTKAELEILYPRIVQGGVLIIDDYGHWGGARKAVDEYFSAHPRPLFHASDYTGRIGVKLQQPS